MSGRGKGGKGFSGKGKGGKLGLAARHRHAMRPDPLMGIEKAGIRKLARRAGVKRVSGNIYAAARQVSQDFLNAILHDAISYVEHGRRKTVTVRDILAALERNGRKLYM